MFFCHHGHIHIITFSIYIFLNLGTLWVGEIVWLIMNEADVETAGKVQNRTRVPILETCRDDNNWNINNVEAHPAGKRIISTHLMPEFFKNIREQNNVPRVIVVMRNPKDTLVSYYHFYRANAALGNFSGSFQNFFKIFEAKKLNHGDFFDHTIAWCTHPLKGEFLYLTYEDMKENPEYEIDRICKFLGKTLSKDQIDRIIKYSSFDQMKKNPMAQLSDNKSIDASISPYVRKGKVGDWKSLMKVAESEKIDRLCREKLQAIGIDYKYE